MKLYFFLPTILLLSCQNTQKRTESLNGSTNLIKDSIKIIEPAETVEQLDFLIDSLTVGRKTKNKLEIQEIRNEQGCFVNFHFYSKQNNNWLLKNDLKIQKDPISSFAPKISDFNNDGFNDLTFVSSTAARGANEIRRLYIYDKNKDKFVFIKNSESYPNLLYNSELNCIDAFLVYAGCTTVFLNISGDSLREFASVQLFDGITVRLTNSEGKDEIIYQDSTKIEGYFRYKNFRPLKVNTEY